MSDFPVRGLSSTRWAALLVTALAISGASGCALWGPEGGPGGAGLAAPTASAEAAVEAVLGPDGVQRVEVTAGDDLRFSPSVVRARPGVIEFRFRNIGMTPHDVRLTVTGAEDRGNTTPGTGNLNGGHAQTVRITVDRAGRYPFPCLYHVSSGMQGTLEVV